MVSTGRIVLGMLLLVIVGMQVMVMNSHHTGVSEEKMSARLFEENRKLRQQVSAHGGENKFSNLHKMTGELQHKDREIKALLHRLEGLQTKGKVRISHTCRREDHPPVYACWCATRSHAHGAQADTQNIVNGGAASQADLEKKDEKIHELLAKVGASLVKSRMCAPHLAVLTSPAAKR
jgi:hypothetical protein